MSISGICKSSLAHAVEAMREPIRFLRGIHYGVSGPARTPGLLLVLVAALFVPRQALAQKMYWADTTDDKIQRANLDGTSVENVITAGLSGTAYVAIDRAGGKIYWTEAGLDKIMRANLDGTGVQDLITTGLTHPRGIALDGTGAEVVVSGLVNPVGIALDVAAGKMYWVDQGATVEDST